MVHCLNPSKDPSLRIHHSPEDDRIKQVQKKRNVGKLKLTFLKPQPGLLIHVVYGNMRITGERDVNEPLSGDLVRFFYYNIFSFDSIFVCLPQDLSQQLDWGEMRRHSLDSCWGTSLHRYYDGKV